jgi:membrane-anchored protein YejM (alkaline phosphatase superfamily)
MDCDTDTTLFNYDTAACYGLGFVARISFVLGCFHFVMFLAILPRSTPVSICHDGCWLFKFLIVFAGVFASIWIPNENFFKGYLSFCMYISAFFLFY